MVKHLLHIENMKLGKALSILETQFFSKKELS